MNIRPFVMPGMVVLLATGGVPLLPQPAGSQQRYPTFTEAEAKITADFLPLLPERLQLPAYQDTRTTEDVAQLNTFLQAWERVSPNTARFLGEWYGSSQGNDLIVAIYPSNQSPGRVCVLQYLRTNETYQFGVGSLVFNEPQINITGGRRFITSFQRVPIEGEHLVQVTVDPQGSLQVGGHVAFPRPLREPAQWVPAVAQASIQLRNYQIADCTTGLPEFRSRFLPNYALTGEDTRGGVTLRFTGAYVNDLATSRNVVAYWTIENLSDRSFTFYPNRATVVDGSGQPITCPEAMRPQGTPDAAGCARLDVDGAYDPVVEPGESITGQVTILRRFADLQGSFLILPEASLQQRQLQVPIQPGS